MSITGSDTVGIVSAGAWWADSRQTMAKEENKERKYSSKIYRPTRPAAAGPGGLNEKSKSMSLTYEINVILQ